MNAKKEMKKLSTPAAAFAPRQIVQRDPLYCIDLLAKDAASVSVEVDFVMLFVMAGED